MKRSLDRLLSLLEMIAMTVAVAALVVMMLSITVDAFGRYFLNRPLQGQYEFTTLYLMVVLTYLGLARTQAIGGHIAVPVLAQLFDRIPGRPVQRLTALISVVAFGFVTVVTGHEALARIAARTTSFGTIQWPTYLSYCWVPVGVGLLTLRLAYQVIWPPEPPDRRGPE